MRRPAFAVLIALTLVATACGGEIDQELVTGADLPAPSTTAADSAVVGSGGVENAGEPGGDPVAESSGSGSTAPEQKSASAETGASKALVLAAVDKSTTEVDSVRMAMTMTAGGIPDLGGGEATFEVTAAIADGGRASELEMDLSGFIEAALSAPDLEPGEAELMGALFGEPIVVRVIGGTSYVSASLLSWIFPVETPWIGFESEQGASDMGLGDLSSDPSDFVALLRGVDDDAEVVGTEVIDGVDTTHIRGSLSVRDAIEAAPADERESVAQALNGVDPSELVDLSAELFHIDVWIGADDLVRRMVLSIDDLAALDQTGETPAGAYMDLTLEFTGYGSPIEIEAPPASDVTFLDADSFGFGG